ncbi:MAG TPA: methyl-accepting chemotaxis protein [Spirochaetota bacterium]|nr:methyl-accepting chemotaxis protein [Spirochaetota bacterium]
MKKFTRTRLSKFELRTRVMFVLFILISSICISITVLSYFTLKKQLFEELKDRLKNISYTGSFIIDKKALTGLVLHIAPDYDYSRVTPEGINPFDEQQLAPVEKSEDFLKVCSDLNLIRDAQPDLLLYAYILIPTGDPGMFRFVADADAPALLEKAAGDAELLDEITRFGKLYESSADSIMANAVRNKINMVETQFAYDEEGKSNIVSGYAPIMDGDKFLGILGLDISDKNADMKLKRVLFIYIMISIAAILSSIIVSLLISGMISRPLRRLVLNLRHMTEGEGDLTSALPVSSNDELGQAAMEFNRFTGKLQEVIGNVKNITTELNSATTDIKLSIDSLSENLNGQSSLEGEVSSGSNEIKNSAEMLAVNASQERNCFLILSDRLTELSASILQITKESELASNLTVTITDKVARGKTTLYSTSSIMDNINSSSGELTGIAGLINDISDQINLLSLNAAIESARAGEAGRGFAVVADEISKLADKTAMNVKDINRIIQGNTELTNNGIKSVNSMIELFNAVIADVASISVVIEQIFNSMKNQSKHNENVHDESETMNIIVNHTKEVMVKHNEAVNIIADSITSMNKLSSDNRERSAVITKSAGEISSMTSSLMELINYFKVRS